MTALSDRAAQIETQRDRLYDGIKRIYDVWHAYCACADDTIKQAIDADFEDALQLIDIAVIRAGALYVVELKKLADKTEAEANRAEKEGTG
ncbi:hypothetical protein [Brevibacterium oceani]|uniref:hypothetical protein n=1 Tax=Brevibacterium oceani TaxID=358099 RepID=UPI0015E690FB|nr:hypothetical protein [Brevibacterium oceani]